MSTLPFWSSVAVASMRNPVMLPVAAMSGLVWVKEWEWV